MRLGIVSDIHCQFDSLTQALQAMGPIDQLLCLGDAISQHQFCNQTVGLLHRHGAITISGNHEEGFFANAARTGMDPDLGQWLQTRPSRHELEWSGRRLLMVHSTPWASGHPYIPPHHRDLERFAETGHDVVLYGHTHQPMVRTLGQTLLINPGSVGEGRPTVRGFIRSCAVLDLETMGGEVVDF